jgi:maleate isomerase
MIRSVEKEGCEAVAVVCTNMRGAPLARTMEATLGIPVYDSIATAVWKSLLLAGADPGRVIGWGGLFQDARLSAQA